LRRCNKGVRSDDGARSKDATLVIRDREHGARGGGGSGGGGAGRQAIADLVAARAQAAIDTANGGSDAD